MSVAIALRGVTRHFGHHSAVENVTLEVRAGELVGLVGPDGAGKTTLARLAAGAIAPTAGKVEPESRGRVGYLTGRFSLYPELTVWENLVFFAKIYGMKGPALDTEAKRMLEWVGLLSFRDRLGGALSGGMRQKLALACAIIHQPPTLILDEPTTAVDPVARLDFWNLLREQARAGRAVLVTTPYMDEAEFCHRVALLHQGRVLAEGTAEALKARLPYRMARLTPVSGHTPKRAEVLAAAEALPGCRRVQPMGVGVRVALAPDAPLAAPPGYELAAVAANLEDAYVWLCGEGGRAK